MKENRKIIVTCALFYANGPLHLGHIVESVQADIWVKFKNMRGNQCFYISGSDCHGTPIMLRAEKENVDPLALITRIFHEHEKDFKDFNVEFSNFYPTHSPENQELSNLIYSRLQNKGDIKQKIIKQFFDPIKQMFLPDRMIKGECPKCQAQDQYGDNCEACGATYAPTDLKNPRSVISGATPLEKESEHYFFELPHYEESLKEWATTDNHLQKEITHKLQEWFEHGLQSWDISRDKPYFGFEIPDSPGKYFYVWLDAPIGYIASFKNFCTQQKNSLLSFDEFWNKESQTELYHFIGKDIMYFHTLFWPAMLMSADLRTPTAIFAHGFLTINGQKMSKSRGTFIKARTYLNHLDADYLRYYFAAKLNSTIEDIDLNLEDFVQRVNADLVGKVVNIASRCAPFIQNHFHSTLSTHCNNPELLETFKSAASIIIEDYEQREYSKAMREIMLLADKANQYIAEKEPWKMIKDAHKKQETHDICSLGIHLFKLLILYLKPVVPKLAKRAEDFLNITPLTFQDLDVKLINHHINPFNPLLERITPEKINAMIDDSKKDIEQSSQTANIKETPKVTFKPEISIDEFAKVDLRIAKIISASSVEGADKLLQLKLDVGGIEKQVFAGIKSAYNPEKLIGKQVLFVANLKPRQMKFGLSEGMILAASGDTPGIFLLFPDEGAEAGMIVK